MATLPLQSKENWLKESLARFVEFQDTLMRTGQSTVEYFGEPSIFFSWDSATIFREVREKVKKAILDIDIAVIIGYSFPTFNRRLDRDILNSMHRLEKV